VNKVKTNPKRQKMPFPDFTMLFEIEIVRLAAPSPPSFWNSTPEDVPQFAIV
jgi:hypothetical protein